MTIKVTIPNTSSDSLTFGSANTPTAAQVVGIDSGSSNGQLAFNTTASGTSTEAMRITAAQNVGIGTTTPATKLTVATTSGNTGITLLQTAGTTRNWLLGSQYNVGNGFEITPSAALGGTTFTTPALVVDSSGNLLVGTTTAQNARLVVETKSGGYILQGTNSNSVQIQVAANGNVQNSNNSYGAISDVKLKENIVDATPKLEKLNQVRIVNYNLIGDEHKQLGVIAQELEQVFPSMIEETPDLDEEGNNLGTTTKGVKYSVFVPMLVKAIQEQQALITQQVAALTTLTERITALEAK